MSFDEPLEPESKNDGSFQENKLPYSKIIRGSFPNITEGTNYVKTLSNIDDYIDSNKLGKTTLKETRPPEIAGWRRAITEDKPAIKHLETLTGDVANILYRKQDIDDLIKNSYFPIVQVDSNGELISFTAYDPYPNVPAVPAITWSDWLATIYRLQGASPRNVLFIHYMVWQPQHRELFLRLLLETSFSEFFHVKHIIIVKPPRAEVPDFYMEHFFPVLPYDLEKLDFNSIQSLLVCLRSSIIRNLPIRIAFEEEFEVIKELFKNHNVQEGSSKSSGCSLDIINFVYQEGNKMLLCEFGGHLAGVMVLNLKIDLDLLNEGFELAPFQALKKVNLFSRDDYLHDTTRMIAKRSSIKLDKPSDLFLSSEFLFGRMRWDKTFSRSRASEMCSIRTGSFDTFSSKSSFSEFSYAILSSLKHFRSSDTTDPSPTMQNLSIPSSRSKKDLVTKMDVPRMGERTSIKSTTRSLNLPKSKEQSNAFIIDFFAIDSKKLNERLSSFDFLQAAFRIVPDRDYCILIIPTDLLPFPLLDLFVRVTPRIMSNFKRELYLCHKNSLSVPSMTVRAADKDDLVEISDFLKNINEYEKIYQEILSSFNNNSKFQSFLMTVDDDIVGISLIAHEEYIRQFHLHFDVANYSPIEIDDTENQSLIKFLILHPIYQVHARFFIRDIMRIADLNFVYYIFNKYYMEPWNVLSALDEMVHLKPKQEVELAEKVLSCHMSSESRDSNEASLSLRFLNKKLCAITKSHVNVVIVVVGASGTALSFLESLIFGPKYPYVIYNNLICVTPHGLDNESREKELGDLMFPIQDNFSRKYLSLIALESYVSFIHGVMTEINRKEKYIVVNNKAVIKYDYLVLTCGLQFLSPTSVKAMQKKKCNKGHRSSLARFLPECEIQSKDFATDFPYNMFVINTTRDAKNALLSLEALITGLKGEMLEKKIIVYGHNLNVFLTIHALLKLGIPGEFITFVEPFPSEKRRVTLFNDHNVDQAVLENLKKMQISYYTNCFFYDWSVNSDNLIYSVTFLSNTKKIVLPCIAFFPYGKKIISDVTYKVCIEAGLVYDGKLVIDKNFRTNDKHIYAAGTFTKYSKRYFSEKQDHRYCSAKEVGQKLANIIRNKIYSLEEKEDEDTFLVPQMTVPVTVQCQLPGDFNYFKIRKPGKEVDLETAYNLYNYGEVLTTGDCQMKKGRGYFRLHLNPEGFVETVTCFTKEAISCRNLTCLYGLHEKLLNNLILRFDLSLVPDFFSYFQEPWADAIYHQDFEILRKKNYKLFLKKLGRTKIANFSEMVVEHLIRNKWEPLPDKLKHKFRDTYKKSLIEEEVIKNLIEFLKNSDKDLSQYALPHLVPENVDEK